MIEEGFELMLVGMGVVFSFLVLLVGLMQLIGICFSRSSKPLPESGDPALEPASARRSERQAVAIAAAYRIRRGS